MNQDMNIDDDFVVSDDRYGDDCSEDDGGGQKSNSKWSKVEVIRIMYSNYISLLS